jgi:hemerythrin-like domain-containing protein
MTSPHTGAVDQPIQDFSDCHVGIVNTLGELASLSRPQRPSPQRSEAARRVLAFFRDVVGAHHREEEHELFAAVMADAAAGDEHAQVDALVKRLVDEHRRLEALYARIAPALSDIERGHDVTVDVATCSTLVGEYRAHADFEEAVFLPVAQNILGRNSDHMAALGLALHIRHATHEIRHKFGFI